MPATKALRSSSAIALAAALLATGAPAVGAAESPTTARAAKIRCVNQQPEQGVPAAHRFRVPRQNWETQLFVKSCKSKRGRITVNVVWRKGAGSQDSMATHYEHAAARKPGFAPVGDGFVSDAAKFQSPKRETHKYAYTYRGENDRRLVIAFGDRYTLLRVTAPNSKRALAKKVAKKARTTMVRRLR